MRRPLIVDAILSQLLVGNLPALVTAAPTLSPSPVPTAGNTSNAVADQEDWQRRQVCDYSSTAADNCPPRQSCTLPSKFLENVDDDDPDDDERAQPRCFCQTFFGHEGDDCDEVTGNSIITACVLAIFALSATFVCGYYGLTLGKLVPMVSSGKLPVNPAVVCAGLGFVASLDLVVLGCTYITSSLLIDANMDVELKYYGFLVGVGLMFAIPCMLLICLMWIDVAMGAKKMKTSKAEKAATKRKMNCLIGSMATLLSLGCAFLGIADLRVELSMIMLLMIILMGALYFYAGRKLATMLGANEITEGQVRPGLFGTATTAGDKVVQTTQHLASCCGINVLGTVLYVVFTPTKISWNVLRVFGVMFIFESTCGILLSILLYVRFGLRKALGLKFEQMLTTQTSTTTSEGTSARVAPA